MSRRFHYTPVSGGVNRARAYCVSMSHKEADTPVSGSVNRAGVRTACVCHAWAGLLLYFEVRLSFAICWFANIYAICYDIDRR